MGMLAAVTANAHRDSERRPTPFGPDDFLRPEPMTPEDAEARRLATLMERAEQWTRVFQAQA